MTAAGNPTIPALAMDEGQLTSVLESSLYPGASQASIALVINYCRAAGLDPMQKPVHIVPMWDSKAGAMRDVIMPGVGLYRIQAARSDALAGISEPEFGEDVHETIGGTDITYPKWCRVTVRRRLPDGTIAEFTARELWRENYAAKGGKEKSVAPNAMWTKRPYGQLGKCAQAQALRMAFPEMVGAQPTADEMEGKSLDDGTLIEANTGEILNKKDAPKEVPAYAEAQLQKNLPAWQAAIDAGRTTPAKIIAKVCSGYRLSTAQADQIRALKKRAVDPFIAEMDAAEREHVNEHA